MTNLYLQSIQLLTPFSPIKIIFIVFALFAWSRALLTFRNKSINQKELIFWSLLWVLVIIFVLIPGKTTAMAKILGMGRGFDAMIFIAVVALFYAVYRLYVKSNETELALTELVRFLSLKDRKINRKRKVRRRAR